jgi:hypothetical protein
MTDQLDEKTDAQAKDAWKQACMNMCRTERNRLIAETDYINFADVTVSDDTRAAILAYRQELRDFPEAFSALYDAMTEDERGGVTRQSIPFPVKPA